MFRLVVALFILAGMSIDCTLDPSAGGGADDDDSADTDLTDTADDDTFTLADDDTADDDTGDDDDSAPADVHPYEFAPPPSNLVGVFVATTGDDANPGSMASPKRTFAAGVATATLSGKAVYVAEGDYSWAIDDYVFVSVYGGYEPIGWTRDIPSQMTRLVIPGGDAGLIASTLQNIPIVLEGLTIVGEAVLDGSPPDTLTSYLVLFADLAVISQDRILAGGSSRWARALDAWGPTLVVNSEIGIEGFVPETSDDLASTVMADRLLVLVNSTVRGGSTTTPNVTSYGIYAGDLMSVITVINSLVTGGSVPGPRGRTAAIYAAGVKVFPPFVTVANSIIDSGQSARAGGFHLMVPWFMLLLNSDVWGAALTCYYDMILDFGIPMCLRQPGQLNRPPVVWTQAFDNISADPLLAGDGIHLLDGSSCIDAGFDLMTYPDLWLPWSQIYGIDLAQLISQDIDGDPRPQDWGWDIGPDEWVPR